MSIGGVAYDDWADVYDLWVATAPVTAQNHAFYFSQYVAEPQGPVVELGIGTGRIALEAVRHGRPMVGVDSSAAMLALCRERAEALGVAEDLTLIQADFRDFELPEPARLIAMPFHTIGHLIDDASRMQALGQVYRNLAPGGRFIFDHFVMDPELAHLSHNVARLRAEETAPDGRGRVLWQCSRFDFERQQIRILAWTDELLANGEVVERRYRRLDFSWLEPRNARRLLEAAGFRIGQVFGSFAGDELTEASKVQIWEAIRQ